ncbi:HAD-IIIA family hydrolase [uncultured Umboniibacter sp.]|uniref:KdsC family phosphatase n=1 Tax=uncultured Umboniibacter sp. TaxID=1798917 RepID=UPI0026398581|nr:HAD-IIIA family hydrolase [uncultured Umboniibacter sp.]
MSATDLAKDICFVVTDVDGVLTNGQLMFTAQGEQFKNFNTLDGHGIKLLQSEGIEVAIITGRTSEMVLKRATDLGIKTIIQGREDKWIPLQEMLAERNLQPKQVAYVGDDWPDLACIRRVGLGVAVANADEAVKAHADYITERRGGEGAFREVASLILKAQDRYDRVLEKWL